MKRIVLLLVVSSSAWAAKCWPSDVSGCPVSCTPGVVAATAGYPNGSGNETITLINCDDPATPFTTRPAVPGNNRMTWRAALPTGKSVTSTGILVCIYGGGFSSGNDAGCPATASLAGMILAAEQTGRVVYAFNYTIEHRYEISADMRVGATSIPLDGAANNVTQYPYTAILDFAGANQESVTVTSGAGSPGMLTALNLSAGTSKPHAGSAACASAPVTATCVPFVMRGQQWPRPWQDVNCFMHFLGSRAGTPLVPGDAHDIVVWGSSAGGTFALLSLPQVEAGYASAGISNSCPYAGAYKVTGVVAGEPVTDFMHTTINSSDEAGMLCGGNPGAVHCNGTGAVAMGRLLGCYPTVDPSPCWALASNSSPTTYWSRPSGYPPLFLLNGGSDAVVPPAVNEVALRAKMIAAGVTPKYLVYAGYGHASEYCDGDCRYGSPAQAGNPNSSSSPAYAEIIAWINSLKVPESAAPALEITLHHSGDFTQGQIGAAYTIEVRNGGTAATSGEVKLTDSLPLALTLVSMAGTGWTCSSDTCLENKALPAGSSFPPVTVTVNVGANAPAQLTNQAAVSGGGSAAAVAADLTQVLPKPSVLSISKTHTGVFARGQSGAPYTVRVSNRTGAGATRGRVTVTESLPSGLSLMSMSGSGWDCPAGTPACSRTDQLAPGAAYPAITVKVAVAANAPAQLNNRVTVSGGGSVTAAAVDATVIGGGVVPSVITIPAPGSIVAGPSVTFQWTAGIGISEYWLAVTTGVNSTVLYNRDEGTSRSQTVTGLPVNGETIHVQLWSRDSFTGLWTSNTYTYIVRASAP